MIFVDRGRSVALVHSSRSQAFPRRGSFGGRCQHYFLLVRSFTVRARHTQAHIPEAVDRDSDYLARVQVANQLATIVCSLRRLMNHCHLMQMAASVRPTANHGAAEKNHARSIAMIGTTITPARPCCRRPGCGHRSRGPGNVTGLFVPWEAPTPSLQQVSKIRVGFNQIM
jgi:hypothetical protein